MTEQDAKIETPIKEEEKPTNQENTEPENKKEEKPAVAEEKEKKEEESSTVYISNISKDATTKVLTDFFSFCGEIKSAQLRPSPTHEIDGTQVANIEFENPQSAKTALLLDNTLIMDLPIKIVLFTGNEQEQKPEENEAKNEEESEFVKGAATAVGGIVASGYVLGEAIRKTAENCDNAIGFTAGVKKTASDIDQTLGLTAKANATGAFISQKFTEFDNAMGLSLAAHNAGNAIQETAANVAKNPYVSSTFSLFKSWGNSISKTYDLFRKESITAIEAKKAEEKEKEEKEKEEKEKEKDEMKEMPESETPKEEEKAPEPAEMPK